MQAGRGKGQGRDFVKIQGMSIVLFRIMTVCILLLSFLFFHREAMAAGATISITTKDAAVEVGDTVYVVITVRSTEELGGFDGYFTYDNRILQFVTGGSVIHGNDDAFRIDDTERAKGAEKITYSVKFLARKEGSTAIVLRKPYHVYAADEASSQMSVSYNSLNIQVSKEELPTVKPKETKVPGKQPEVSQKPSERPKETKQPEASAVPTPNAKDMPGSDKLRKLSIKGVSLAPEFSPSIKKYSAITTTNDRQVAISYESKDSRAKVVVKGNEKLRQGKNQIKLIVTGTTGKKTVYRVSLNVQRENDKSQKNYVTVTEKKGKLYLKGTSEIEVLPVEEKEILPEGFEEEETIIDGKKVTAYALKSGKESSFVLIYGKGDKKQLYLYDKDEQILLPYEKVKFWYRSMNGEAVMSMTAEERTIQSLKYMIGIMGAFCGFLLLLMIFMGIRSRRK